MNNAKYITASLNLALGACLMVASQAVYADIAGNLQFAVGSVQAANPGGRARTLQKGDAVNESDTVTTARGASAQLKMRDGGVIFIRPDSQLRLDTFVLSEKQDGSERNFFSLLKGGIRAITGLIGQKNKSNYRISTPVATIGIRGTDHEIVVVTPDSPLAAVAPVGTYNKVNMGETIMTSEKGTISILPNQMGFTGAADQMPQLQPVNLKLFTITPAPLPQAKPGKGEVREDAVVDNAVEEPDTATGNAVPKSTIQIPIKGRTGGQTAGGLVF